MSSVDDVSVDYRAKQVAVAAIVVVTLIAAALGLWKLRGVIALLFLGFTLAAAVRSSVEALARFGIPRPVGVLLHYLVLLGVIAVFLSFVVPTATHQVNRALASASTSSARNARTEGGIEHEILVAVRGRLRHLPPPERLVDSARTATTTVVAVIFGVAFTFAVATYWIFERERAIRVATSVLPPSKRRTVEETWLLIDLRLGAYVRGVLLMVLLVSSVLSVCFWLLGLPYWLILGPFAGVVEILPVIGPLIAGATAIGVALTVSWQLALKTALVFYALRLLQDYLVNPRVLGGIVDLSPLVVLLSVSAVALLVGPAAVPLATPFAAVLATLFDVIVRRRDPGAEDAPKVILPAPDRG